MTRLTNGQTPGHMPWHHTCLLVLVALASVTRIYDLDYLSLWADELWGILACSKGSWMAMFENLVTHDSHPPGYQTFLYYWLMLADHSDFLIRLPSALAGILAVLALYRTGCEHFSRPAGLLAATLMATSFQAIYYSQEARAYSMLLLACSLHYGYFFRIMVDGAHRRRDYLLFTLSGAAMLYLHYSGSVLFFCEGLLFLLLWLRQPSRAGFIRGALAITLVLVLYAPWLPWMYRHATSVAVYWSPKPGWPEFFQVWHFLAGRHDQILVVMVCLLATTAVWLCVRLCLRRHQPADTKAWSCYFLIGMPMVIFFAKSIFSQSIHTDRHFLYALPLIYLLVAYGLAALPGLLRGRAQAGVTIGMLLVLAGLQLHANANSWLYKHRDKHDFRGAVALLAADPELLKTQRLVVASTDYFDYYLQQTGVTDRARFYFMQEAQAGEIIANLKQATVPGEPFYLLDVQINADAHEKSVAQQHLDRHFTRVCKSYFNWARVAKYLPEAPGPRPPGDQPCFNPLP